MSESAQSSLWERVKAWMRRSWAWLAIFAFLLVGFLVSLLRRRPVIVQPVDADLGEKAKERAEAEAQQAEQEARVERDHATAAIDEDHHQAIEHLTAEQRKKYEELRDDPEAVTTWLLDVGKKTRGQ